MTPLQKSIAEIEAMRKEKIKEIAEFDGWKLTSTESFEKKFPKWIERLHVSEIPYLTELNELHRVALDVANKVSSENMIHRILNAMLYRPINGEYTALVDAVYDAIVYLKNHNQSQLK